MRATLRWCAALLAASLGCSEPSGDQGLSLVLVVVDTVRADHLSLYGSARPTSPALARAAERGAVFERAFASSPWTVPSMASLLTGQNPARHGAGYRSGKRHGFTVLRDDVQTLAGLLAERGYETAAIVNNTFLGPGFGLQRGFQHYDHAAAGDLELRRAPEVVELALDWLRRPRSAPSLLLVHLMDPHIAYDPPPEVRGAFTAGIESRFSLPVQRPAALRRRDPPPEPDRRFLAAAYDEELLGVDRALERLLVELEDGGLLSGSLVLLTSDHGEEFFEHGGFEHGHALYQELLHVPLVVWGPGVTAGRHPQPVSLVDVLPTLLEAVGAPVPEGLPGRSLWGLLTRGEPLEPHDLVAEGMLHGPERRALIRWPYKLDVRQPRERRQRSGSPGGRGVGITRLFDLERDPEERHNLAAARPELVAELRRGLDALAEAGPEAGDEPGLAPLGDDTRQKLVELGYVEDDEE